MPLIWRTTDAGKTWTSIVNGLPRDERTGSWINSLRVDPEQPGLLFAGSETTVYVSFDNGDHWQSLRQNLPSTSIRGLDVHIDHHENDLVIATYGRGFWVLDDITPLRQIAANAQAIAASPVYLFKPEEAIRARINSNWDQPFSVEVPHAPNVPYGAIVDYYLSHEPSGPIQLQVFDSKGNLVRTMSSTPPPPIEDAAYPHYWLAAPETRVLSTHVGLNRVNWNLLYDDPPALRHDLENQMNMVAGSTTPGPHGPQVIPGVYTLKLTVDGKVFTRDVTVMNDPRVGESPALMDALRTQNKLTLLSVQGMEHSFEGHEEVNAVQDQLATLMKGKLPADVAEQAKTLRGQSDQNWRRHANRWQGRRRRARPGCGFRSQCAAIVLRTEQRIQHHGQHDAGRPRYGAHSCPDRHLAERLHRPEPYRDGLGGRPETGHRLQCGAGQKQLAGNEGCPHQAHRFELQLYAGTSQEGKEVTSPSGLRRFCSRGDASRPGRRSARIRERAGRRPLVQDGRRTCQESGKRATNRFRGILSTSGQQGRGALMDPNLPQVSAGDEKRRRT